LAGSIRVYGKSDIAEVSLDNAGTYQSFANGKNFQDLYLYMKEHVITEY